MKLKITLLTVIICFLNCKQETTQEQKPIDFNYKYKSVEKLLDCQDLNTDLFQEAVLSFEDDLIKFYTPDKPVYSRAYSIFTAQACSSNVDYNDIISEHSKKILEALKQIQDLWIETSNGTQLNYQHPVFYCIGLNIKNEPIGETYNALIATNSMSVRMIEGQLRKNTFRIKDNKYLATFVALELYYSKIFNLDSNSANTTLKSDSTPIDDQISNSESND